ncbi:MAG: DUF2278 family protein [Phycisphaerae bacterium]|jgi:uncharacterized protein YukJ
MSLKKYGVLKGRAVDRQLGAGSSPHYEVHIMAEQDSYRIAVNVKSALSPSELLYLVDDDFEHPVTDVVAELPAGFTALSSRATTGALDYIRGNLFDRTRMRALPHNVPGPDNDLNEKLDAQIQRAMADENATVYAFGERWGPEPNEPDKYFEFLPGNGIHDIHMNQGNVGRFVRDDGVWQDGGLLIHFPEVRSGADILAPERWVGVFLAFQSQSWHTDDQTGHAIPGPTPPVPDPETPTGDGMVRIVAALVNPTGGDVGDESVTLLNTTPHEIDLNGWIIADKNKKREVLSGPKVAAGDAARIVLSGDGAQLSNKGGIISLLDPTGLKIDGVSYTKAQAKRQAWTLKF